MLFIASVLWAKPRTVEQAQILGKSFFAEHSRLRGAPGVSQDTLRLVYTAAEQDGKTPQTQYLYVFGRGKSQGFVIVSSDSRAKEILGYADAGSFDPNNMPDNLQYWFAMYEKELEQLANTPEGDFQIATQPAAPTTKAPLYEASVAPLIQTKWNQGNPYNLKIPLYDGQRPVSGCVATAMAQIMKYHEWPDMGTGSHSYTHQGITHTASFETTAYEWTKMQRIYSSAASDEQKNAVATLMYHCGVAVNMSYGVAASGAYSSNVPAALKTYFDYDPSLTYLLRDTYTHAEWAEIIKIELTAGRPLYYGGHGNYGGHAFVCDGYDAEGKFHFNWGWGGISDGYFELSALDPLDLGIGGGHGGFYYSQVIIAGVQPPASNPAPGSFRLTYVAISSQTPTSVLPAETFQVTVSKLRNRGGQGFTVSLGLALYNAGNESLEAYNPMLDRPATNPLKPAGIINPIQWAYTLPDDIPDGDYRLCPAYATDALPNEPHPLETLQGGGAPYLTIRVASGKAASIADGGVINPVLSLNSLTVNDNNPVYQNRIARIEASITNSGSDYNQDVRLTLSGAQQSEDFLCLAGIAEGETKELTFFIQPSLPAGPYDLSLYYDTNSFSTPVSILPEPPAPSLSLAEAPSFPNAARVNRFAPNLKVSITNTGGFYDGSLLAFVFPASGGSSLTYFGEQNVFINQGEKKEVTFNSDIALNPGQYGVIPCYISGSSAILLSNSLLSFTLVEPDTDNTLSSLTPSAGELLQAFSPGIRDYTLSVPFETTQISLSDTPTSQYAVLLSEVTKPLNVGKNTFPLVVTAENGSSNTYTVVVTREAEAIPLNADWIAPAGGPFTYTGACIQPSFSVNDGTRNLTLGVDYKNVTYGNNKDAGSEAGDITLTGMGAYSGTVTKRFDIGKKPLTAIASPEVTRTYNGTNIAHVTLTPDNLAENDENPTNPWVILTAEARFDDKNAGSNKAIAITGIALEGSRSSNYEAPSPSAYTNLAGDVTPAGYTCQVNAAQTILQGISLSAIVAPAFGTGVIVEGHAEQVLGELRWFADADRTTPADNNNAFAQTGLVELYWEFVATDANYTPVAQSGGPVAFTVVAGESQHVTFAQSSPLAKVFGDDDFTNHAVNSTPGGGNISYAGSRPDVATVDAASGRVTILAAGETEITATAVMVAGKYRETTASYTLIVSPKPLAGAKVDVTGTYTYNGLLQTPDAADIIVTLDGTTLTYGTDYTSDGGGGVGVGEASFTVEGRGNYTGRATGHFSIGKRTLEATASACDKVYDATTHASVTLTPLNVAGNESVVLTASGAFADANAGTGKAVVLSDILLSGVHAGNYNPPAASGITAPLADITPAGYTYVVGEAQSLQAGSPLSAINVAPPTATGVNNQAVGGSTEWFGDALLQNAATDASFASAGSIVLYWRFTPGNPNYISTPATGCTTFTLSEDIPQLISFALSEVTKTYGDAHFTLAATNESPGGGEISYATTDPTVAVVDAGSGLVQILKAGNAVIKATAAAVHAQYAATEASYTLKVLPKSIEGTTVMVHGSYTYNANLHVPADSEVSVADGSVLLNSLDYTFERTDGGIYPGTATLAVTGRGNYTGHTTAGYQILPATLSLDATSSLVQGKAYDGTATAIITSVAFAGLIGSETLTKDADYTLTNVCYNSANATEANKVTATVALLGTGSVARNYTLANGSFAKAAHISKATVATGADQVVNVPGHAPQSYSFNLATLLPDVAGTLGQVVYSIQTLQNADGVLDALQYTSPATTLMLPVRDAAPGRSAVITIRIESDNYADFYATITVRTISRKQVSIAAVHAGGVYTGAAYAYTGTPVLAETVSGVAVTGLVPETLYENQNGVRSTEAPVNAGLYKLILSIPAHHPDYIGSASFDFSITKRPIQVVADDKQINAGDPLPAFTCRVTGLVEGETAITGTPLLTSPTANREVAGEYPIEIDLTNVGLTPNYMFASAPTVAGRLKVEGIITEADALPAGLSVVFHRPKLLVNSPSSEVILVYSFDGRLLFSGSKPAGEAIFPMGRRISEKIILVKGSSGWIRKIAVAQ